MKFVCDVCPITGTSNGQRVIIGEYDKWIRHLLTPVHQSEQQLTMIRTNYWPVARYVASIKNLPKFNEETVELYVDIMKKLSRYGFVEAIYYGSKAIDNVIVAVQLHSAQKIPPEYLTGFDNEKYEVRMSHSPRYREEGSRDNLINRARSSSVSSTGSGISTKSVGTSPVREPPKSQNSVATNTEKLTLNLQRKSIKYDREELLRFHQINFLPPRFVDILEFPKDIIRDNAKLIDLGQIEQLRNIQWQNAPHQRNMGMENVNRNFRQAPNQNGGYVVPPRFTRNALGHANTNTRWNVNNNYHNKPMNPDYQQRTKNS